MINDNKISRKEFLAYTLGLLGVFLISSIPKALASEKKDDNHYGNNAYGGKSKV